MSQIGRATAPAVGSPDFSCFLILYGQENRYVKSVVRTSRGYSFSCSDFDHPFHVPEPAHLTREHVIVYVTQAICVATGLHSNSEPNFPFTAEHFIRALTSERASIRSFEFKYQKYVPRSPIIELDLEFERIAEISDFVLFDFRFRFPAGVFGCSSAVVSLTRNLVTNNEAFS